MGRILFACIDGILWVMKVEIRCSAAQDRTIHKIVLHICAADFGYGDPGCCGGTLIPTPAMDSLACDGVRSTGGYVSAPVRAPSRCGLMTGSWSLGMPAVGRMTPNAAKILASDEA
jgi:hypothetical protein